MKEVACAPSWAALADESAGLLQRLQNIHNGLADAVEEIEAVAETLQHSELDSPEDVSLSASDAAEDAMLQPPEYAAVADALAEDDDGTLSEDGSCSPELVTSPALDVEHVQLDSSDVN